MPSEARGRSTEREGRAADPVRDGQMVTPEGERVVPLIDGVRLRPAVTHVDERGTVCEIYNPAWGFSDGPLVFAYQATVRPGRVKGWVVHHEQDDRMFVSLGTLKVVLFDDRPDSATRGMLNEIYVSEVSRALLNIPRGVFHAVENVGHTDALFVNLPTAPYRHDCPDKYRLPLDTDRIPYRFEGSGW